MNQQLTHGTRSVPPNNRGNTMNESFDSVANILNDVHTQLLEIMSITQDKQDDPKVKNVIDAVEQMLGDIELLLSDL